MAWNLADDSFVRDMSTISCDSRKLQEQSKMENKLVTNILTTLKQFREESKLCDLRINVNHTGFHVHKTVVAAWSPNLANYICPSKATEFMNLNVQYDNVEAFSDFLEYLYSGFILPTETNVIALLDLAKNFKVDSLSGYCEDFLKGTVSSVNYVSKYFTSLKYGLKSLEEVIVAFIEANISNIIEQPELLLLSPEDFETFFTIGQLANTKQEIKFSLIISWVGYNLPDRDHYLLYLFENIPWNHSVNDLLIQIRHSEQNIFTSSEICLFQLLHSLVSSVGLQSSHYMTQYQFLFTMYSHKLPELARPKVFQMEGPRIEELVHISVSVQPRTSTKDAEVNTDVDSSYFQENQAVFPEFIMQEAPVNTEPVNETEEIIVEPLITEKLEKESTVQELGDDEQTEFVESLKLKITGHRRKGMPRKIPLKGVKKEGKEKKPRGRPRKISSEIPVKKKSEDDEGTELDAKVKEEAVEEDYNGETDTEEWPIADTEEDINNEGEEMEKLGEGDFTQISSNRDILPIKTEKKPKIKLSINLKRTKMSRSSKNDARRMKRKKARLDGKPLPKQVLPIPCTEEDCDYSTKTLDRLHKHIESVHNTKVKLDCKKCEYTTNLMRELCLHMKEHYPKLPYICGEDGCTVKFLRMGLLVRHQMSHLNEKPYKCDLCSKSFATFNQLSCHKKLHEGRQYECDVCFKRFTTKGVMQQHRAIHFDNKPYLCDTCGFSTKHLSHLISHRKIHTGDVLRCTFPNCSYSTPKQGHMTQHVNTHLDIRNHTCQVCGKSFVVRGKLLRHERIHLKDKLYKCKQCDYQTSRTDRMKLHIESHGIKFKKKKYNLPKCEEENQEMEIDYHHLYEKVAPQYTTMTGSDTLGAELGGGLSGLSMVSMADMKTMDAISLAASASMIVDNYSHMARGGPGVSGLMDTLHTAAAVASLEEMQNSVSYQQSFERINNNTYDPM